MSNIVNNEQCEQFGFQEFIWEHRRFHVVWTIKNANSFFKSSNTANRDEHKVGRSWLRVKFGICFEFNIRSRVRCSIMSSIMCSLFAHFEFSVRVRLCSIIYDFPWLKRLCGNYSHTKIMGNQVSLKFFTFKKLDLQITARFLTLCKNIKVINYYKRINSIRISFWVLLVGRLVGINWLDVIFVLWSIAGLTDIVSE